MKKTAVLCTATLIFGGGLAAEQDTFGPFLPAFGSVPAEGGTPQRIGKICTADAGESCDQKQALKVYGNEGHVDVAYDSITPFVVQSVVAVEDHGFWQRTDGVSTRAIARAIVHNIKSGELKEGGSTIDRQLAGMGAQYTSTTGRIFGQLWEMSRAKKINQKLTQRYGGDMLAAKQEIVRQYLNSVYFGRQAYGIEAAAMGYFGKHAHELTKPQSALLAGVINEPSNMDLVIPHATTAQDCQLIDSANKKEVTQAVAKHPTIRQDCTVYRAEVSKLQFRYDTVVTALQRYSGVPKAEADALRQQAGATIASIVPYVSARIPEYMVLTQEISGMHAVHMAERQAVEILGIDPEDLRGYTIVTTIRSAEQRALSDAIMRSPFARIGALDVGGIVVGKDGAITAMVGSKDHTGTALDFSMAPRQMGSAIKPFIWTKGYEAGLSPDAELPVGDMTVPGADNGKDWVVRDHACEVLDREAPCTMNPAEALAASSNAAAVRIAQDAGPERVFESMEQIGIPKPHEQTASSVLGTSGASALDMAAAYNGLVAHAGRQTGTYLIDYILNSDGKVVYRHTSTEGDQTYEPDAARQTIQGMKLVHSEGTARGAAEPPFGPDSLAGKTGTSDNARDLRYAGTVCIPVGNADAPDTRTVAISIGDPSGQTMIPGEYSSNDAARIGAGALVEIAHAAQQTEGSCDVAQ